MAAFLFATAVMVGAWVLAIAMCRAAAAGDRQLRDAAERRRADVVDLATARRRRNSEALGRRA